MNASIPAVLLPAFSASLSTTHPFVPPKPKELTEAAEHSTWHDDCAGLFVSLAVRIRQHLSRNGAVGKESSKVVRVLTSGTAIHRHAPQ